MKLRVDIPAETKISIKHKQKGGKRKKKKRPLLPGIYGLKLICFHFFFLSPPFFFFTSIWFVLDIQNVITDLEFH